MAGGMIRESGGILQESAQISEVMMSVWAVGGDDVFHLGNCSLF